MSIEIPEIIKNINNPWYKEAWELVAKLEDNEFEYYLTLWVKQKIDFLLSKI